MKPIMLGAYTKETDVTCIVRDGTVLRADVYRPSKSGLYPVLLCRTPYDKSHLRYEYMASELARRGYIAVVQDIRGRSSSGGEWAWHLDHAGAGVEQCDGFDSCEWAAGLEGSDRQVGTFGNSYPSWCIWQMAAAQPPSLKAIFTSGFPVTTLENTCGVFETGIRLRWHHNMAVSSRLHQGDNSYPSTEHEAQHNWDALLRGKYTWQVPLDGLPDHLFGPDNVKLRQYWRDIAEEFYGLDKLHFKIQVPTCTLTGWWDRINSAASHFTLMRENGPSDIRDRHRLIIGPWVHDVEAPEFSPLPRDYGPEAKLNLPEIIARWYDYELKGIDNGLAEEPPVRVFMLNQNRWRFEREWPPQATQTPFYLDGDKSGTVSAAANLGENLPNSETTEFFVYDPANPVPSLLGPSGQAAACDQAPLRDRGDILKYQTEPLSEDVTILGPVSCKIWVASDCPDTDFFARLIEVGKDGLAINLSQGMLRMRYRNGFDREDMLVPDLPFEIKISMMIAGVVLKAGSRIRLDITSSDFPTFDRNHNTGRPFYSDAELRVANQTLFFGPAHPSHVTLPVMGNVGEALNAG